MPVRGITGRKLSKRCCCGRDTTCLRLSLSHSALSGTAAPRSRCGCACAATVLPAAAVWAAKRHCWTCAQSRLRLQRRQLWQGSAHQQPAAAARLQGGAPCQDGMPGRSHRGCGSGHAALPPCRSQPSSCRSVLLGWQAGARLQVQPRKSRWAAALLRLSQPPLQQQPPRAPQRWLPPGPAAAPAPALAALPAQQGSQSCCSQGAGCGVCRCRHSRSALPRGHSTEGRTAPCRQRSAPCKWQRSRRQAVKAAC